jgi:hypothetical protein
MRLRSWRMDSSIVAWAAGLVLVSLAFSITGCRPGAPAGGGAPVPAPQVEEPDAPKGEAVADPAIREARDQADAIFGGLLAGKFDNDPDLSPVARKVKGYQSYSIKSQKIVRAGAADFHGVLTGPAGRARFDMTLMKQVSGNWAIGRFSGPNPE